MRAHDEIRLLVKGIRDLEKDLMELQSDPKSTILSKNKKGDSIFSLNIKIENLSACLVSVCEKNLEDNGILNERT